MAVDSRAHIEGSIAAGLGVLPGTFFNLPYNEAWFVVAWSRVRSQQGAISIIEPPESIYDKEPTILASFKELDDANDCFDRIKSAIDLSVIHPT